MKNITLIRGKSQQFSVNILYLDLAEFEGAETKVTTLVGAAMSPDNLCRMDPAWHPWL
jgi:transformation/transcription domain-associated protein